jgi:thiol:disulfide interchange protein
MRARVPTILLLVSLIGLAAAQTASESATAELTSQGMGKFILAAIGAGLFALTTPCVFPIIPVTVSFFAKQAEKNPHQKLSGPLAYCAGLISAFTVVGVAASIAFGAAGLNRFAQHPVTNIALGLLFIVLALSLFGLFEIQMPQWLVSRANEGRKKGGLIAPFSMGLTFALTSFTCTIAFVGTLLAAAAGRNVLTPIVGMLFFSATFALPFFLLALFPSALAKMPKSGGWMSTLKGFMGFLEIAAALKFFQNADIVKQWGILTREVYIGIWFAIFIMAGVYLLGWMVFPHHDEGKPGPLRRIFGLATIAFAFSLLTVFSGRSLGQFVDALLPPTKYPHAVALGDGGPVEDR